MQPGSSAQASKYADASAEVRAALMLDGSDLDALEQAAKLAKLLNAKEPLQKALDDMERAAETQKNHVRHSRVLRFQAELFEERATKAALNNARVKLETALKILDDGTTDDEKPLELALVNEQLAALHLTRKTTTLVEPYLDEAEQLFGRLPARERIAGEARIETLRKLLIAAQRGTDEPEEPEEKSEIG